MRVKIHYVPTVIALTVTSTFAGTTAQKLRQSLPTIEQKLETSLGDGCRISMLIPDVAKRQWLVNDSNTPSKSNEGSVYIRYGDIPKSYKGKQCADCAFTIGVGCYNATDPDPSKPNLADGFSVNFDVKANRWVSDRSRFEAHLREQGMDEVWVKKYADADHFYELTTKTAKGFAMTRDHVIGDESRRERRLHYCLIREPKAICGQGVMGTLEDIKKRPKTDLTPYALQILRTIEFVDDVPSSDLAASSP